MATIQQFSDLDAWRKARELSMFIYRLTQKQKFSRDFELKDQINGSSGSTMDNIAEGFGRKSRFEFVNFLTIAMGSNSEAQSQAHRAFDREYISQEELEKVIELGIDIEKMCTRLITYLNKTQTRGLKFKDRIPDQRKNSV